MSWKLKKKAQGLVASEEGTVRKDWGGRVDGRARVPEHLRGRHVQPGLPDHLRPPERAADVVCERVFFPDPEDVDEYARTGTAPFSLESQRPLTDFDLVGFSITYEGDYINVVRLLRDGRASRCAPADRRPGDPRGHDGRRLRLLESRADRRRSWT